MNKHMHINIIKKTAEVNITKIATNRIFFSVSDTPSPSPRALPMVLGTASSNCLGLQGAQVVRP